MRRLARQGSAPPVRMVHLGLGNFFRAHQAAYTALANAAVGDPWGIAAFSGRRTELVEAMSGQGGVYTLVSRAAEGDTFSVLDAVSRAIPGGDEQTWESLFALPKVRVLTLTVTEAGYDPVTSTAVGRIVSGLLARRAADAGPITLVPCDNVPANGAVLADVLRSRLLRVDASAAEWFEGSVSTVSTMVDRITPATTAQDLADVAAGTGIDDRCPVLTEPFTEWLLAGSFPGGRPAWETAGARFVDDVGPYEERKLWLLNGGHSLLAYLGLARGLVTVAEAVRDEFCRHALTDWWAICTPHLSIGTDEARTYCETLLDRFDNPRIRHGLVQIATDGSQKLPVRMLPVLRAERAAGRLPEVVVAVLGAWIANQRGEAPAHDVRAAQLHPAALPDMLAILDPALADDAGLVSAVRAAIRAQ